MLIAKEQILYYFCRFLPFDVYTEVAIGIDLYKRDDRWNIVCDFSITVVVFDEDVIASRLLSIDLSNSTRLGSFEGTLSALNCRDRCS